MWLLLAVKSITQRNTFFLYVVTILLYLQDSLACICIRYLHGECHCYGCLSIQVGMCVSSLLENEFISAQCFAMESVEENFCTWLQGLFKDFQVGGVCKKGPPPEERSRNGDRDLKVTRAWGNGLCPPVNFLKSVVLSSKPLNLFKAVLAKNRDNAKKIKTLFTNNFINANRLWRRSPKEQVLFSSFP